MSLLDTLIYGYRTVYSAAAEITRRNKLNFSGGLSASDNAATGMTDVVGTAATSGGAGMMSAADKTKLDGMQAQGASVAIAALEINWSLGGVFSKTLAAGANVFTFANATDGWLISVDLTSNGGGSTVTWPTVLWTGGVAPTQTSTGRDLYTFVKRGSGIIGTVYPNVS